MSNSPAHPTASEDRVPVVQKIGYGLGTVLDMWGHWLYPTLVNQVFNIGLGLSPALVSTAIMLNRVFDAFSDPLFGWWSDNTRTRWGRRRPFMLVGAVIAGACLPLLFWVHPGWTQAQYFWFMVVSSALYIPVMSCFYMPYVSLGAELTPDYHERTSVMSYKYAVQKLPELGLFFAAQFTTLAIWVGANSTNVGTRVLSLLHDASAWAPAPAGTQPNILLAAQVYCMCLGALMIVAGIVLVLVVRERYYDKLIVGRQERASLFASVRQTVACRPFRLLIGMRLAYCMGLSMVGTLGYYDTVYYVCRGDLAAGAGWNFWMGVSGMLLGFAGIPLYTGVARRFGKRHGMRAVMLTAIGVFVGTWWFYDPMRPWLQPLASGFIAFTGAGFWTLDGSMLADVIDYDELQTGQRREGVFASAASWIVKCGMALGAGAAGFILSSTGFDVALGGNQTPHTLFMIRFLLALIPILGLGLALWGWRFFRCRRKRWWTSAGNSRPGAARYDIVPAQPTPTLRILQMRPYVLFFFLTGVVSLAAAEVRLIAADAARARGPLNRMAEVCVGAGRANEGLRADWQRQLRFVHENCGFRYIRFHGLFCDDMGVYQEDKQGRPVYNWQYVDELFDFITGIGMKPFVELSFMPEALASGRDTIFWYRANVTPPKDYAKWEAFIAAFVRHATERYGADEVRSWYFEVWNEPNLDGFWLGKSSGRTYEEFAPIGRAEYFKLYATTARAVKSVDAGYRVGGPATAGSGWIDETLAYCAAQGVPLDFVSTHTYATTSGYLDETGNAGTVFSPDREAITAEVRATRAKLDRSAFARAELHYTEWSSSYTPADPIHDSYHSAAFILDKLRQIGATAQSMSYWTFTDIFEESGPRTTPFHGGFGLLNYQALPKPSYFAYNFLHRLGDVELDTNDASAFVCRDGRGALQALFWDFTITHPGPSVINQEFYARDQPAVDKGTVRLAFSSLAPGDYRLTATRVGYRRNDVQSAWRDLGSPAQLTRGQVAELRAAASGDPEITRILTVAADGRAAADFPLRTNDVWFVEIAPVGR